MEKKQQIYLSNSQEPETLRELKGILKEREDFVQGIRKRVDYFQGLLVKIHFKLGDAVNHSLNNPYQNWSKAQTVNGILDRQTRDSLQQLLEAFESRLSNFRLTMRTDFDRLENAEQELTAELSRVDELVEEIEMECIGRSEDVNAVGERERKQSNVSSAKEKQDRLEQEMQHKAAIGEIDRELARIGRFGNWDVRDHDAFIRVWNHVLTGIDLLAGVTEDTDIQVHLSSSQNAALMKKLRMDVFAKNEEELAQHVQWYCRFMELTHRKKLALSRWRRTLASRRHRQQGAMAADNLPDAPEIISADDLLDQMNAGEISKGREAQEKRHAAKQRLAKWKMERETQMELERRQKIREQAQNQQTSARDRQRRKSELHDMLENWKRDEKHRTVEERNSPPRPSSADSIALKRRYKSDLEKAKTRKAQADMAKNMQFERERRFSELPGADLLDVQRDPARLLTGTKASEAARVTETDLDAAHHRRESAGAHLASMAMTGRDLLHVGRGTPAWMRPPSH